LLGFAVVCAAPATFASGFLVGEVLVGGRPGYEIDFGPAYIQAYSQAGIYQRDAAFLPFGHPRDAVMVGQDVLFVDAGGILRMRPDGTITAYALSDPNIPFASMTMDSQQNIFVGGFLASATSARVFKLDPSGETIASFTVPSDRPEVGVFSMDLAIDQCTLLYAVAGPHVKRYDVCRSTPLPDLYDFGPGVFVRMMRSLPDGTLLVAASGRIVRLSPAGEVIKTYGENVGNPWVSLSMVPGEASFWAGGSFAGGSQITKFELTSGAVLVGPLPTPVPSRPVFSVPPEFVLVVGEHRAAQSTTRRRACCGFRSPK
jgi:hypothetical protein